MSLQQLVEDYLADCRARGLSPKILRDAYGYPLQHVFLPWCDKQGLTEAGHLTTRTLNRFTSDLRVQLVARLKAALGKLVHDVRVTHRLTDSPPASWQTSR